MAAAASPKMVRVLLSFGLIVRVRVSAVMSRTLDAMPAAMSPFERARP